MGSLGLAWGVDIWGCCNALLSIGTVLTPKPKYRTPLHPMGSYRLEKNEVSAAGRHPDPPLADRYDDKWYKGGVNRFVRRIKCPTAMTREVLTPVALVLSLLCWNIQQYLFMNKE